MAYYAGDPITDTAYVENADGDPSSAPATSVFSSALSTDPDGNTSSVSVSTTATPGLYSVIISTVAALPGTYTVLLVSSETGVIYTQSYDVDPALPAAGSIVLPQGAGITFGELRQRLAMDMRDCIKSVATADGSPTTYFDRRNFVDSYDSYVGAEVIFTTGPNMDPLLSGADGYIVGSDPTTGGITFNDNLPAVPVVGDACYMINPGGRGFRKQVYDYVIQETVADSWPYFKLPAVSDSTVDFDGDSPTIAIPPEFRAVTGLSTYADTNVWREIPNSRVGSSDQWGIGYRVDTASRLITVASDYWRSEMDETSYRINGYAAHPIPVLDSDSIVLDRTWLVLACKQKIAERRAGTREWDNWAVEWGRRADAAQANIYTPLRPNTIMLP